MSALALSCTRTWKTKERGAVPRPGYALHSREKSFVVILQARSPSVDVLGLRPEPAPPAHRHVILVVGARQDSNYTANTSTGADTGQGASTSWRRISASARLEAEYEGNSCLESST